MICEIQGVAGIKDILQNQYMAALQVYIHILFHNSRTGRVRTAVRGDDHKIHLTRNLDLADHIRVEDHHAFENANDHRIFAGIIPGQLLAQFGDARPDLLLTEQHFLNISFHRITSKQCEISLFTANRCEFSLQF